MAKKNAFAHLFGGAARSARVDPSFTQIGAASRAEDDDEIAPQGSDDEPGQGDPTPDDENGKRGKKAKKAKRARRAEDDEGTNAEDGDDETDAEDQDDDETAKARARERGRIGAIMSSNIAAGNPVLALDLALHTRMTRNEVIGTLMRTQGASAVSPGSAIQAAAPIGALDARMERARTAPILPSVDAQSRPSANSVEGVAARLLARHNATTGR